MGTVQIDRQTTERHAKGTQTNVEYQPAYVEFEAAKITAGYSINSDSWFGQSHQERAVIASGFGIKTGLASFRGCKEQECRLAEMCPQHVRLRTTMAAFVSHTYDAWIMQTFGLRILQRDCFVWIPRANQRILCGFQKKHTAQMDLRYQRGQDYCSCSGTETTLPSRMTSMVIRSPGRWLSTSDRNSSGFRVFLPFTPTMISALVTSRVSNTTKPRF